MNKLDAVLIGIVVFSFIIGYFKGLIKEALSVVSILISALVTYIYFKCVGASLMLFLVFVLSNLVLGLTFWAVRKYLQQTDTDLSLSYRLAGGGIGAFKGIVFVLIMLAVLRLFGGILSAAIPNINNYMKTSFLCAEFQKISRDLGWPQANPSIESVKEQQGPVILSPEVVNKLTQNDSVKAILADQQLMKEIKQKNYGKILSNPKFLKLLNDKELLKQVYAGLVKQRGVSSGVSLMVVPDTEAGPPQARPEGNRLQGVVYSPGSSTVVIGGGVYQAGDKVAGGEIVEITPKTMTLQFPDKRKVYLVGENIP